MAATRRCCEPKHRPRTRPGAAVTALVTAWFVLAGCTLVGPADPAAWSRSSVTTAATTFLHDRYGEDFTITEVNWNATEFGRSDPPTLTAAPVGDDSELHRFAVQAAGHGPGDTPQGVPLFEDGYLAIKMAPTYEADIDQAVGDLFIDHRIVVWLSNVPDMLPGDIDPSDYKDQVRTSAHVELLLGGAVPPGATAAEVQGLALAVEDRLSTLAAASVALTLQTYSMDSAQPGPFGVAVRACDDATLARTHSFDVSWRGLLTAQASWTMTR